MNLANAVKIEVSLPGRDRISLSFETVDGALQNAKLIGSGCPELLRLLVSWRPKISGKLAELEVPTGIGHADILLREALLKAKGEWKFPYDEEELCHCRAVSTARVDSAIVGGCHSIRSISRETSAGTSCGSCRSVTEALIAYRLARD